jgi:hypothetical protein
MTHVSNFFLFIINRFKLHGGVLDKPVFSFTCLVELFLIRAKHVFIKRKEKSYNKTTLPKHHKANIQISVSKHTKHA